MLFLNYLRNRKGIEVKLADRRTAIAKNTEMPVEQVLKVLIFMAGMEAGATTIDGAYQQNARAG